ncbi:MAG TPA: hypothetical protein VKZ94_03780 [Advenella sp.]|nr:hypothetical protein [Advenella sp.]
MTKSMTRSLFLAATCAGVIGLAGCAGNGYDSGASTATDTSTSAQAPMTSDGSTTAPAATTQPMPATTAPTAQP